MLGPGVWNHSLYPPTHRPKDEARPEGRLELLLLRGGHRRAPPMVRLVFCLASPPATSSRLVEHAKLTQRVEAGVAATKARGWLGRKGGWHWPGAYVSTDGPASVSGPWRGQGSPGKRWAAAPREGFHRLEESPGLWGRRSLTSGEPSSPAQPESPSPTLCLGLEGLGTRRTQKALTRGAEAGRLKQRLGSWGGEEVWGGVCYKAQLQWQLQEPGGGGWGQDQALSSHGEGASLGRLEEMFGLGPFLCQQDPLNRQVIQRHAEETRLAQDRGRQRPESCLLIGIAPGSSSAGRTSRQTSSRVGLEVWGPFPVRNLPGETGVVG